MLFAITGLVASMSFNIAHIFSLARIFLTCSCNLFILFWQERSLQDDKFSITTYLCYLFYAPLYIAGPIISFNAFASQVHKSSIPQQEELHLPTLR